MSDNFSFDEQRISPSSSYHAPKGMVGFLMNKCGVREEATANLILIVFALVIFAIAGFVFWSSVK